MEGGREVLAAVVVDELYGGLLLAFDLCINNDPVEAVVLLGKVAGEWTVEVVVGDVHVVVEVDAHIDAELLVGEISLEGLLLLLCAGGYDCKEKNV